MKTIIRKKHPVLVTLVRVGDLETSKCSKKFLALNLPADQLVHVKILPTGEFDLRGKNQQYRIIKPDNQ